MREPLVSRVLKVSLYIIFILGILGTVTLPFMLDYYFAFFRSARYLDPGYSTFITAFMVSVALPGLWIILEMIWMLRSIPQGPFIVRNVRALSRIGVILLAITAMFLIKCFVDFSFLTMACTVMFLVCGLFAFTLSNLFRQAVIYKEENDLTI